MSTAALSRIALYYRFTPLADPEAVRLWQHALCERLAAGGRRVVRYDLRDSGESTTVDPEAPAYTLRDLAADAAALAQAGQQGLGRVEDGHAPGVTGATSPPQAAAGRSRSTARVTGGAVRRVGGCTGPSSKRPGGEP